MADGPDNLTLEILKSIQSEIREMRTDINDRLETLETQMGGVGGMLTLIYGKQLDHEERIEAIEAKGE